MASIMTMIHYCIVFVVAFLSLILGGYLVLPSISIFIPGLGLPPLTLAYRAAVQAASSLSGYIIGLFFALYCVYKILRAIFPVSLLIGKIPPFRELRQAGIFALFDSLINAVVQRGSMADRLKRVGKGLAGFVMGNFNMIRDTVKQITGYDPSKNRAPPGNTPKLHPQSTPQDYPENDDQSSSPFSNEEVQQTRDEYQQCLEETLIIVTPDMSNLEVNVADTKNATATILCQVNAVKSALNNFAFRM